MITYIYNPDWVLRAIDFFLKKIRCALMHRQWRTSKTSLMKKLFST